MHTILLYTSLIGHLRNHPKAVDYHFQTKTTKMDPNTRNDLLIVILSLSISLMSIIVAGRDAPVLCLAAVGISPLVWIPLTYYCGLSKPTSVFVGAIMVWASWGVCFHERVGSTI